MKLIVARIISVVFHPLLMATYLFGLLSFVLPSALDPIQVSGHKSFILLIFIATFLLPALNISIFKLLGSISSYTMVARHERLMPFTFITVLYGVITYFLYARFKVSIEDNVLKLMLVIDLLILSGTLITYFYRVSIHSLSMWGMVGMVMLLNKVSENNMLFTPTIVIIILAGIVMSARLLLQAHTLREVLLGSVAGFVVSAVSMFILF